MDRGESSHDLAKKASRDGPVSVLEFSVRRRFATELLGQELQHAARTEQLIPARPLCRSSDRRFDGAGAGGVEPLPSASQLEQGAPTVRSVAKSHDELLLLQALQD